MWWIALVALAAAPASDAGVTVEGEQFGREQPMTCLWFSNFENSRFESCRAAGRELLRPDEGASLRCRKGICDDLEARATRAAQWTKSEPVWGTFVVQLVGRLARTDHKPRYLGDGTSTVLIEKLLSVEIQTPEGGR